MQVGNLDPANVAGIAGSAVSSVVFDTNELTANTATTIDFVDDFSSSHTSNIEFAGHVLDQELQNQFEKLNTDGAQLSLSNLATPYIVAIPVARAENRALTLITQQLYYGTRNGVDHKQLDEKINDASRALGSGYLRTGEILAKLGKLDVGVKKYLQKSHSRVGYALDQARPGNGLNKHYYSSSGTLKDNFELEVKTRDGDNVKINVQYIDKRKQISAYKVHVDEREIIVDYNVDGNLSEQERKALEDLLAAVGNIADDFFQGRGRLPSALSLGDFDKRLLQGFELNLEDLPTITDDPSNSLDLALQQLNIQYEINDSANRHHLLVNYNDETKVGAGGTDDYSIDIDAALNAIGQQALSLQQKTASASAAQGKLKLLEQQIDLSVAQIREKDSRTDKLFNNVLREMLGFAIASSVEKLDSQTALPEPEVVASQALQGLVKIHPDYQALENSQRARINAALLELPDFTAQFALKKQSDETGRFGRDFNLTLAQKSTSSSAQSNDGLQEKTEQKSTFRFNLKQQSLRNNGAQRVVETTKVDQTSIAKAQYLDGILTSAEKDEKQSAKHEVNNFHEQSLGYLARQRLHKPLNGSIEAGRYLSLLKGLELVGR